jgi:hypothetical protein
MKQIDNFERIRKRELRIMYRNKCLENEQKRRAKKTENTETENRVCIEAAATLREDNRKTAKPDKRPGPEKFLELYSYIPGTAYDSRHQIPLSWKPHSFSERRQHLEFLRTFVYPHPLPEVLLWISHSPEYMFDRNRRRVKTPNHLLIKLAKKWVIDIVSGESFFKRNREYFTKSEAHFFLNSKIPYIDSSSVLKLYFYAKCRARAMSHRLSILIADVFSVKFFKQFTNNLVESFLDLLGRTPLYNYERGMLGDLCDFILRKMTENRKLRLRPGAFSFSGRTVTSVIALANEWHEQLRREEAAGRVQREAYLQGRWQDRKNGKLPDTSKWDGMGLPQFRHETDEYIWTITELKTAQDLLNEGRKMKNCVASYAYSCASGNSAVFTVERVYPVSQAIEKAATLEVHQSNRTLVQAKGKCNSGLTPKTMNIVTRWAAANRITVRIQV